MGFEYEEASRCHSSMRKGSGYPKAQYSGSQNAWRPQKQDLPNFTQAHFDEIGFITLLSLIVCNSESNEQEDLNYNLLWAIGIILTNENLTFEFLKEREILDLLYLILFKSKIKIQSMVIHRILKLPIAL